MDITTISGSELLWLSNVLTAAIENDQEVRLSQTVMGMKVSRGGSMWSPNIGRND